MVTRSTAADSLAALNTGRAALVLLHDDPADDRLAWFTADSALAVPVNPSAPDPTAAGADQQQLAARLVDVAVE